MSKSNFNLSVIIPCHNEANNIPPLISRLIAVFTEYNLNGEILIVDDNSTDDTATLVKDIIKSNSGIKLVERKDGQCGVGRTFRAGFEQASGEVIITMDGDLSHDPADIPRFLDRIETGADLVIGSRYGQTGGKADMPVSRRITSGSYNWLARHLFGTDITDLTTGYRAIRKEALDSLHLTSDGFAIHPEIHLTALNNRLRVTQIPIVYHRRLTGSSKLSYLKVGIPYIRVFIRELLKRLFSTTPIR